MSRFGIAVALLSIVAAVSLVALANERHPAHATHTCLSHPGAFRLDSYEALTSGGNSWRTLYSRSMELAAHNQLVPDVPSFALDPAEVGSRSDGSAVLTGHTYRPFYLRRSAGLRAVGYRLARRFPMARWGQFLSPTTMVTALCRLHLACRT